MNLIYLGKLVNTHGIKGEVRIISDFKYKEVVFKKGSKLYIDNKSYIIETYRVHKNYDMVKLDNINSIDDALNIKGLNVYINRDEYEFNGYLDEDLIGLSVYDNEKYKGKVIDIYKTNNHDLLVIDGIKRHMVPNINNFVKEVDLDNKKIYIEYIGGLDNED
ncbi:MAG: 16S rRNA processing protein RimM [Bacilli bacterium]|nr:16S rRNA processing protein RimM [Bacilli bacterium]